MILTERQTATVQLSPEDLAWILEHHGRWLRLRPTLEPGVHLLTPTRFVGVLVGPRTRFVIRPKVACNALLALLADEPVFTGPTELAITEWTELPDLLALRLAELIRQRWEEGLRRDYREQPFQGPLLQGRLDLPAQLREVPSRRDFLHSRAEVLTADVPCNQVPCAILNALIDCPGLTETTRQQLSQTRRLLWDISPLELTPAIFRLPVPEGYEELLSLCRMLWEGLNPAPRPGGSLAPGMLFDLEQAFERYVTRAVRQGLADCQVEVQPTLRVARSGDQPPELVLRPDLVIRRPAGDILVLDAKWKRLNRPAPRPADLYQVLAYCAALGAARAVLVYPGRSRHVWRWRLQGQIQIQVRTLPVEGTSAELWQEALRMAGTLSR